MPELSIMGSTVAAVITPAGANQVSTSIAHGVAGGSILPGQVLYADPSTNGQLKPAQATSQLQASNIVGIALNSATLNQPITYAISGDVQLQASAVTAGTLISGSIYVLAAGTAGNIIAVGDGDGGSLLAGSGNFMSVVGIGNGTATGTVVSTAASVLRLSLIPAAVRL